MGATLWKVSLLEPRRVRSRPDAVELRSLAPWSADGRHYAYAPLELRSRSHRLLLSRTAGGDRRIPTPWPASAILWSPTDAPLLVVGPGEALMLAPDGARSAEARWTAVDGEDQHAGWARSGRAWFVVGRPSREAPSEIRFYTATGELLGREALDPAELVPYDAPAYHAIGRGSWALEIGPGTRGIGRLLDYWSDARYDVTSGTLLLSVHRPTGPGREIAALGGAGTVWSAPAVPRWVAVTLED